MNTLTEYRIGLGPYKTASLDAVRRAIEEMLAGKVPLITEVSFEHTSSGLYLVGRYETTACYFNGCGQDAVMVVDDVYLCDQHTLDDVIAQEESEVTESQAQT